MLFQIKRFVSSFLASGQLLIFVKYFLVGVASVLVNLTFYALSLKFNPSIHLATLAGNVVSTIFNFTGLQIIFRSTKPLHAGIKYLISLVIYYYLSVELTILLISFDLSKILSRALVVAFLFPFGFLANKFIIFKLNK